MCCYRSGQKAALRREHGRSSGRQRALAVVQERCFGSFGGCHGTISWGLAMAALGGRVRERSSWRLQLAGRGNFTRARREGPLAQGPSCSRCTAWAPVGRASGSAPGGVGSVPTDGGRDCLPGGLAGAGRMTGLRLATPGVGPAVISVIFIHNSEHFIFTQ